MNERIRRQIRDAFAGLSCAVILTCVGTATAVENHGTGAAGDGLWTNASSVRLDSQAPIAHDVIIADAGSNNAVVLNASVEVASCNVSASALSIAGSTLFSHGASTIESNAVLNLAGHLAVGADSVVNGTVNWNGVCLKLGVGRSSSSALRERSIFRQAIPRRFTGRW